MNVDIVGQHRLLISQESRPVGGRRAFLDHGLSSPMALLHSHGNGRAMDISVCAQEKILLQVVYQTES